MQPRILVAESNPERRRLVCEYLADRGYEAAMASTGLDCIDALRGQAPDALVLDLDLPWGGGDGVLRMMQDLPHLRDLPVVVLCSDSTACGGTLPRGVSVLERPLSPAILGDWIDEAIARHHRPACSVLVVDDDLDMRTMLKFGFEREGIPTRIAADGEAALDEISECGEEIAAVLLDVQMPRLDGPKTFEAIREFDPRLPVCFMSGDTGDYEAEELLALGARRVFPKPFHWAEVVEFMLEMIEAKCLVRKEST